MYIVSPGEQNNLIVVYVALFTWGGGGGGGGGGGTGALVYAKLELITQIELQ